MKNIILLLLAMTLFSCDNISDLYISSHFGMNLHSPAVGFYFSEEAISDWIYKNIDYEKDVYGIYQSPKQTLERGKGDCEDMAILFMNIAYFAWGKEYSLAMVNDTRQIADGGNINHCIVSIGGRHFDPITLEEYSSVGYIYDFWEVFNH